MKRVVSKIGLVILLGSIGPSAFGEKQATNIGQVRPQIKYLAEESVSSTKKRVAVSCELPESANRFLPKIAGYNWKVLNCSYPDSIGPARCDKEVLNTDTLIGVLELEIDPKFSQRFECTAVRFNGRESRKGRAILNFYTDPT